MDKNIRAFASYSIRDARRSREFYEGILGLTVRVIPMNNECKLLEVDVGKERFVLYEKKEHVPATHTVMNLEVPNIGEAVRELTNQGIQFEHYEGSDQMGIMHDDGPLIAWFKDPDGNFISLLQQEDEARENYQGEAPLSPS